MYSFTISFVTIPTVLQKYPVAHICCPKIVSLNYRILLAFSLNFFHLNTALFVLLTRMVAHLSINVHDLIEYFLLLTLFPSHYILASIAPSVLTQFFLLVSFFCILLSILYDTVYRTRCWLLFAFLSPMFYSILLFFLTSPERIYVAKANGYNPPQCLAYIYLPN